MRAEQVEISAAVRSEVGTRPARRMRAAGLIPAVVYGRGTPAQPIVVEAAAFSRALPESAWYSTLIRLRLEGSRASRGAENVMIREVQRDLIKRQILSVDFVRVSLRENIRTHVPVVHAGESPGVKHGGVLEHLLHEVEIECLPTAIPEHLEVDISGLEIGDSARVSDIQVPRGVKVLAPPDDVVIVIAPPVSAEELEAAAQAAAGAVVVETQEPEVIREREAEEES